MIGAKQLSASIAVELTAAGAEQLAARGIGTGMHFEDNAAGAVFVILERQALKQGVAIGA